MNEQRLARRRSFGMPERCPVCLAPPHEWYEYHEPQVAFFACGSSIRPLPREDHSCFVYPEVLSLPCPNAERVAIELRRELGKLKFVSGLA